MSDLNNIILKESGSKKWILLVLFISIVIFMLVAYFVLDTFNSQKTTTIKSNTTQVKPLLKIEHNISDINVIADDISSVELNTSHTNSKSEKELDILINKLKTKNITKKKDSKTILVTPKTSPKIISNIYVQVGATFKIPSKKFLDSIISKGYTYTLYKTTINGKNITKILIGPFLQTEISNKLTEIKKDIVAGAYIYHAK